MTNHSEWVALALAHIKNEKAEHKHFRVVREKLSNSALACRPGELISVVGPSHSGKTTLMEEFTAQRNLPCDGHLMSRRPVVYAQVRNQGEAGAFATKDLYIEALESMNHPAFTITPGPMSETVEPIRRRAAIPHRVLADAMRESLLTLKTEFLIFDEIQHLKHLKGKEPAVLAVMDSLKVQAAKAGCVLVLVGAYPMLTTLEAATHLKSREFMLEIPRYSRARRGDLEHFEALLDWFSRDIKFCRGIDSLRAWNEALYEGTFGVVGLLSNWVRAALAQLPKNGSCRLAWKHFEASRKPSGFLEKIWGEIEEGEEYLHNDKIVPDTMQARNKKKKQTRKSRTAPQIPAGYVRGAK